MCGDFEDGGGSDGGGAGEEEGVDNDDNDHEGPLKMRVQLC